ncbi:MAG TPA: SRPBCC family protein [Polyangia bacterium]|nr:SRPBCC family protein [Polyangia bacterium]
MSNIAIRVLAILAVLAVSFPAPSAADGPQFSTTERKLLAAGEVVLQELPSSRKNGFYGGSSWVIVDAPAAAVLAALIDWNSYVRVFPNTVEVRELSRKGDRSLVRMRLGHPVISVTYHLEMKRDEHKQMLSFKQVSTHPSDLDDIRGYWRLFPQKDGRTLVVYVVALNVPMGIVNMVGPRFEAKTMVGILGVPQYLKKWVEGPGRSLYQR